MRELLLDIKSLKMYYAIRGGRWVKAVDNISFYLKKGEALAIVGESGSGKSSLAHTIMRMLPSNGYILGGKILFDSINILNIEEKKFEKEVRWKKISIIPQGAMNSLNPVFRIMDQMIETIVVHEDISKEGAEERVKELFNKVGISPSLAYHYPHEFSGGMKQRVMIAMALACKPDIIIADEPTTALDVIVQAQILKLIRELQRNLSMTMILITHDLSIVPELCNKLVIMYAGKVVEYGSMRDIFKKPFHPYTKGLLSAMPSIRGKKRDITSIPGNPPNLIDPPSGCRFHPRCPYKKDICSSEEPKLIEVEKDHFVACHLY